MNRERFCLRELRMLKLKWTQGVSGSSNSLLLTGSSSFWPVSGHGKYPSGSQALVSLSGGRDRQSLKAKEATA